MDSPSFRLKLWASIKQRQTTVGHTTCRYCSVRSYALVRQPFLKWLFTLCSGLFVSQRGWGERKESALTSLWRGKSRPAIARWKFQIICSQGCSVFSQISNKPREFFEPLFFFWLLRLWLLLFGFAQFGIFVLTVSVFALKTRPYKAKTYTNLTAIVSLDWLKLHTTIDLYNAAP